MLRHVAAWFALLATVVMIAGGLGVYKWREIQAGIAAGASFPEPASAVGVAHARRGTWTTSTRVIGTVVALQQTDIRNEIAGLVSEVGFKSGDTVSAGQVLVKLDTRQEEAQLAAAEAEAKLAKTTLDRRQGLRDSPAFNEQELDRARSELTSAEARARNLAVAIDKKRIVAQFAGQVGITDLQPGAYLDAGARITSLQGVSEDAFVDFSVPQDQTALVGTGTVVKLIHPTIPGGSTDATIIAADNSVDRASRTVLFRGMAKGLGRVLRPGTFLDVTVITSPPMDAMFVPLTALRRSADGAHVFKVVDVEGKLRAKTQHVEIGPVVGDEVAVLEGIGPEDLIAAAGSFKLREGALVSADAPPAAASPPPTN